MTDTSPHEQLDGMITAYWISQAIYAAAKFDNSKDNEADESRRLFIV